MDDSLANREQELFKLNEKINARSPKLFNKNDSFAINVKSIEKDNVHDNDSIIIETKASPRIKPSINCNQQNHIIKTNPIPKIIERQGINKDNIIKFLKSKILILEQDNEDAMANNAELSTRLETTLKNYKKIEQLLEQQKSQYSVLQHKNGLLENENKECRKILKDKDDIINELSREKNASLNETIKYKNSNKLLEKQLHKALGDLNVMTERLKNDSIAKKEIQSSINQERKSLESQIKNLKRERVSMLNAFKKQLAQVEAIKKQNINMNECNLIEIAEQQYLNLLKLANNDD